MKYSYFPGCSLKGLGPRLRGVVAARDEALGGRVAGVGRLELLRRDGLYGGGRGQSLRAGRPQPGAGRRSRAISRILAPCAACYLVLNKTKHYFHDYPAMKETIDRALGAVGLRYSGDTPVRHPLDVLLNDVGLEAIKQKVSQAVEGPEDRDLTTAASSSAPMRPSTTNTIRPRWTGCWRRSAPRWFATRSRPSAAAAA